MADSSSQQPSLTVLGGPMAGQRLVLDESVANLLIGSDPSCDFYLPHDSVSPIHARLWVDLEGAVLHDTSSPHGVYVNDERVVGKHPLHNGDIVWLGPPGGADVVMIQCVLAEASAAEEAPAVEAQADGVAEQEALDALAPTLAARPAFADRDEPPPSAEPPAWEPEPPPIPGGSPEPDLEEVSRTQAFRMPADFAAALAAAGPPVPPAPPAAERSASPVPPAAEQTDELDQLFSEHVAEPPPVPVAAPEEPLLDPQAYAAEGEPVVEPEPTIVEHGPLLAVEPEPTMVEPEPALAESEPLLAEVDPYVAEQAYAVEPEPEIVEPVLPEPDATHMIPPPGPAPLAAPRDLPSDFDDMMFSVPEEPAAAPARPAPAAPPPTAAVAPPDETVLLPTPPPRAQAAPAPPAPAVPAAPPGKPAAAASAKPAPPATAVPAPPVAAKPASAARPPRPAAPGSGTVPPRSTPARVPRAAEAAERPPSKAFPVAALAGAGALAIAALAGGYWFFGRSEPAQTAGVIPPPGPATLAVAPVTAPAAVPTPELVMEPAPEPTPETAPTVAPAEDVVTIVRTATPPPRPAAAPTAAAATPRPAEPRRPDPVDPAAATRARIAAQVTSLLGQAQSATSARNYEAALGHYEAILKLEPQNAVAQAGKTSATAARAHARKTFVAARTVVRTEKAGGGLAGFESSGVNVQKAPDFLGRVEYAMTPTSVQPGDPWELKIYVVNEGKKAIKISALSVATVVNGSPAGAGGPSKAREVAPQQRVMVDQLSGTWPPNVTSWRTDVKITAGKNETLQSQLTWR